TTARARRTSWRSPTARSGRWTCARSRSRTTTSASCPTTRPSPTRPPAALRALELPRSRLPADLRRAADRAPARALGLRRDPPHLRPRGHQAPLRDVPLRRAPDGNAARRRWGPLHLLPRRQADRRPGGALHGGDPDDRQDPDPRRLLLPPQHGAALRLPGQRAQLPGQLPLDDVQEDGGPLPARPPRRAGARHPLHPPRRPRAELLDERRPQ